VIADPAPYRQVRWRSGSADSTAQGRRSGTFQSTETLGSARRQADIDRPFQDIAVRLPSVWGGCRQEIRANGLRKMRPRSGRGHEQQC
jgi:hypothetical protein